MTLRDRIGIDVGRRLRLEDATEWAAEHEVRWIDIYMRGPRRHPPLWSIAARCGGGRLRTAAIGGAIGTSAPSGSAGIGKDASNGARATAVGGERSSGSSCGWIAFSNWTAMALVKW